MLLLSPKLAGSVAFLDIQVRLKLWFCGNKSEFLIISISDVLGNAKPRLHNHCSLSINLMLNWGNISKHSLGIMGKSVSCLLKKYKSNCLEILVLDLSISCVKCD